MSTIGPKSFIHLDRCKSNLINIQEKVGDSVLLCVVKANGYGHGAVPIAKTIANHANINFAVFSIDEAMELRNSKINNDIFVFSKIATAKKTKKLENQFSQPLKRQMLKENGLNQ